MTPYEILKILHVWVTIIWLGGFITSIFIFTSIKPMSANIALAFKKVNSLINNPAMILTFVIGVALAIQTQSIKMPWLNLKMALFLVLAAFHGVLVGQIKLCIKNDNQPPPAWLSQLGWVSIALTLGIVSLVLIKLTF